MCEKIPKYGRRRNWQPKSQDDYEDGGAYPEVKIMQYPLGMGKTTAGSGDNSNAIALKMSSDGKVKFDQIVRQAHPKDKVIYSKLSDLTPAELPVDESDPRLQKPSAEEVAETTMRTKEALEKILNKKIAASLPARCAEKTAPAQLIRYTPSQQTAADSGVAKQRLIKVYEAQVDPMEPPKFKINAKIPRGPPSPPVPVMHSPPRRVTAAEQKEWKIPPCVSNWKNAKGFTVPLDKRLAADGRGIQKTYMNEKFVKLSEALYIADRKAREAVEARAQLERKMAQKEKEAREEHLKHLAQKAREERANPMRAGAEGRRGAADPEERERDQLRYEKNKERNRDRNIARSNPEKRQQLERERYRDVSEQIALQMPPKTRISDDVADFDQRLFAQSAGLNQGFEDDEAYNVYDGAWRSSSSIAQHLYRPKNIDSETYGDDADVEKIARTERFVPHKELKGAARSGSTASSAAASSGPVAFEKDDPFGLDKFLTEAKRSAPTKRKDNPSGSHSASAVSKKRK